MKIYKTFPILAAAALALTSCSDDDFRGVGDGSPMTVSFTVNLPADMQTRTVNTDVANGAAVEKLYFTAFTADGSHSFTDSIPTAFAGNATQCNATIELVKGETYNIVFWAQAPDCGYYYDPETARVNITYDGVKANDESRDAFYCLKEGFVAGSDDHEAILTRAAGQVNIGSSLTDYTNAGKLGVSVNKSSFNLAFEAVTCLDLRTGKAVATTTYDLTNPLALEPATRPADCIEVNGDEYEYLAYVYLIADKDNMVINNLEFKFDNNPGNRNFTSIPLQRNYRTNIVGKILLSPNDFNVILDTDFSQPDINFINEDVWDGTTVTAPEPDADGNYTVSTAAEFVGMLEKISNGDKYKDAELTLDCDIDFDGHEVPASNQPFEGTFDGQGHTVRNFEITQGRTLGSSDGYGYGLFQKLQLGAEVKNLVIEGCVIKRPYPNEFSANFVGILAGYYEGDVTIENVIVRNCEVYGYGKVGALLGGTSDYSGTVTLRNVHVYDTKVGGVYNVGGIIGLNQKKIVAENVTSEATWVRGRNDLSAYYDLDFMGTGDETNLQYHVQGTFWKYGNVFYAAWGKYWTIMTRQTNAAGNYFGNADGYVNDDYFVSKGFNAGDCAYGLNVNEL